MSSTFLSEKVKSNGPIEFTTTRPKCSEINFPTTDDNHLPSKSYVDLVSGYTGTTREIEVTGTQIGLPDIIHIGSTDNYTSSGIDDGLIIAGNIQIQGAGNKTNSLFFGPTTSVFNSTGVISDSIYGGINVDMTAGEVINGSLIHGANFVITNSIRHGSVVHGSGHNIGGAVENGSVIGGFGQDINAAVLIGSRVLGYQNIVENVITEGSCVSGWSHRVQLMAGGAHVMGFNHNFTTTALIDNGATVLGNNNTGTGTITDGALISGKTNNITGTISQGSAVIGLLNIISDNVSGGSCVIGESHDISGGNFDFGSLCLGYNHTVSGVGNKNGCFIYGLSNTLDSATTSAASLFGNLIRTGDINNSSNVFISGGNDNLPATSDYYNPSFTSNTYVDNTLAEGLHLVGRPAIRIASQDTEFRDSRPLCNEGEYATTDANHLPSKSYVDLVSTYTGTTREVEVTGTQIGLPDIVHVGTIDNYASTGTDRNLIIVGDAIVTGAGDKINAIAFGANTLTVDTNLYNSIAFGGVSNIAPTTEVQASIVGGWNVDITNNSVSLGSLVIGKDLNITSGDIRDGSVVLGDQNTIAATMSFAGMVRGERNTISGNGVIFGGFVSGRLINQTAGSVAIGSHVLGSSHALSADLDTGACVFGHQNTISANVTQGSSVLGYANTVSAAVSGGSCVIGESHSISGGIVNFGTSIIGYNHTLSGAGQKGGCMIYGDTITVNSGTTFFGYIMGFGVTTGDMPSTGSFYLSGGNTNMPATSDYYNASFTNRTYLDNTLATGLHLVGRPSIRIASTDTEFRDTRPLCNETSYPTTDDNHLASKSYVDSQIAKRIIVMHFANSTNSFIGDVGGGVYFGDGGQAGGGNRMVQFLPFNANVIALYARTSTAPGAGTGYTFYYRTDDTTNSTDRVTISDTNTVGSLTGFSDSHTAGTFFAARIIKVNTPSTASKVVVLDVVLEEQ